MSLALPTDTAADERPGTELVPDRALCPICHSTIVLAEEAFLERCYHRFCFHCILQWTETQAAHPPGSGDGFTCPLCKGPYKYILHDVHDHSFRQHFVPGHKRPQLLHQDGSFTLTTAQRRRRGLYFCPSSRPPIAAERQLTAAAGTRLASSALRGQVELWLRRELQALLLQEDVSLVLLHAMGSVEFPESTLRSTGAGRLTAIQKRARVAPLDMSWLTDFAETCRPFVGGHAEILAEQLGAFYRSGLTVAAYDRSLLSAPKESSPDMQESDPLRSTAVATEQRHSAGALETGSQLAARGAEHCLPPGKRAPSHSPCSSEGSDRGDSGCSSPGATH
mmetsp:Transcript_21591/g.60002  ORF Transcript_21591/g.60002 Transcript_21591/m.60002 type:complete len:336 (-) Transcript_21591:176-1183(-)